MIEPCSSEWTSPIVIIKKKNDTIHMGVDYRKLNAETEMDAYLMPRIDDILDQGAKLSILLFLILPKRIGKSQLQRRTGIRLLL